jgi:hypothetical protein
MNSQRPDLAISNEPMRSLVLDYLSSNDTGQLNDLRRSIANLAVARAFHDAPKADPLGWRYGGQVPETYILSARDFGRACDIIWDDTDREFSATLERLKSARRRAVDPGVSFQCAIRKTVWFFVLFPRNAQEAGALRPQQSGR